MRRAIALLLGMLLPILGLADAGLAQSAVSIPGTIQAVNCQNHTVVLSGAGGANTLAATNSTSVVVNSTSVPFCTLQQYVGDSATAWVVPSGNEFLMTRIDVVGPATSAAEPTGIPSRRRGQAGCCATCKNGSRISSPPTSSPVVVIHRSIWSATRRALSMATSTARRRSFTR